MVVMLLLAKLLVKNIDFTLADKPIYVSFRANNIPFKVYYGMPAECTINNDNYKKYIEKYEHECKRNLTKHWAINIGDFYTDSDRFCCFVQSFVECEKSILNECHPEWARAVIVENNQQFYSVCKLHNKLKCYPPTPISPNEVVSSLLSTYFVTMASIVFQGLAPWIAMYLDRKIAAPLIQNGLKLMFGRGKGIFNMPMLYRM